MLRAAFRRVRPIAAVRQAVIDSPAATDVVDRFAFLVSGWAWLGADQHRVAAIEIWNGTLQIGETDVLGLRMDVCAALRLDPACRTGFVVAATEPQSPRGASLRLAVRVRFTDGTRTEALCERSVRSLGFDEPPMALVRAADEELRAQPFAMPPLPPDHLQVRQVAGVWGEAFFREGRVILGQLAAAFDHAGKPLGEAGSILDFGCGCGRVLAAFAGLPHRGELWGSDIDAEAIAWSAAHLEDLARFRVNPAVPPTSFEAGQFDAIYSVSVFTHLPEELQFAWLTEMRRILRPGGVLIATCHGGSCGISASADVREELATRGFVYRRGPETEGLPDFYRLTLHSEAYIRAKWTRFFDLVAYHERLVHGVHDAVVLRRTAD